MKKFNVGSIWYDRDKDDNWRIRRYQVVSNDGATVKCEYLDADTGKEKEFGPDRAQTIRDINESIMVEKNLEAKKALGTNTRKAKKTGSTVELTDALQDKLYFTLGFLAKNAILAMRTVPNTEHAVGNRYFDFAERYPWQEESGYVFEDHPKTWSTKMCVEFKEPDKGLADKLYFPGEITIKDKILQYYDVEWCWTLIERGFRVGRMHEIDVVKSNVPSQHMKAFEEGLAQ